MIQAVSREYFGEFIQTDHSIVIVTLNFDNIYSSQDLEILMGKDLYHSG